MMAYVVFGLLLAGILFWRVVLPGMKLVKPAGANGGASPAPQAGASSVNKGVDWFKSNLANILLGLVSLVVIGFGLYGSLLKTPNLADAVSWSRQNWLPLLILWGVLAALVAVNAKGVVAKTLQWVLAGVMFVLYLGFPFLIWLGVGQGQQQSAVSALQQQSRQFERKATLSMPPNGDSIRISPPVGYATVFTGIGFTTHCIYRDDTIEGMVGDQKHPCKDGPILSQYVRDTSGRANEVTYEFVRANY
jgi:hypothetical protein